METKESIQETLLFDRIKNSLLTYKSYSIKLNDNYKLLVKNNNNKYKSYINNIVFFLIDNTLHIKYTCNTEINKFLITNYYYYDILINDTNNTNNMNDILKNQIVIIKDLITCNKCYRLNHIDKQCLCMYEEVEEQDGIIINQILGVDNIDKCAICLDNIMSKYDSVHFLSCKKHHFHLECLSKIEKSECPICKSHCHFLLYRNVKITYNCKVSHIIIDDLSDDDMD